jgi:hypothetical protein
MKVIGDYGGQGYALVEGLISPEIAKAFVASLRADLGPGDLPVSQITEFPNLLSRPAFELYGHHYPPMLFFLWGLTPAVREITGRDLLPTYDYLRIYREGDVCRVHYDRPSCEHSLSLTLDYSDGVVWELDVGKEETEPSASVDEDFGDEPYTSLAPRVGDAVLYRGTSHRHGRVRPNPNGWSVHLFLHWVERGGRYADHAFDGRSSNQNVNFQFA